jgi:hypothetical protein
MVAKLDAARRPPARFRMLPLLADSIPTNATALAEALTRGLEARGLTPRQVEVAGATFPEVGSLRIDLTGTQLTREIQLPQEVEGSGTGLRIEQLEITGSPLFVEKAAVEVHLVAQQVQAQLEMKDGTGLLRLQSAAAGTASVEATREALEALVHAIAVEAAAKQGLDVKKTKLTFTQEGPRDVAFRAEVTAKVFVMNAALALTGRLKIDDQMNARFSDLALDGDGMILKLAGGFARPHLDRLEGRVFPLLASTAGGLRLRNLELTAGESLRVRAEFGAAEQPIT